MKIKALMSLAAAAALVVSSAGLTAHGSAGIYTFGDVNGDGTVDATDASFVLAAYASKQNHITKNSLKTATERTCPLSIRSTETRHTRTSLQV